MEWATLIALALQNGIPLALKLAEKWGSKDAVSPEEIAELRTLSAKTSESQMRDAMLRAGIDPLSERGKELLALVV